MPAGAQGAGQLVRKTLVRRPEVAAAEHLWVTGAAARTGAEADAGPASRWEFADFVLELEAEVAQLQEHRLFRSEEQMGHCRGTNGTQSRNKWDTGAGS